MKKLFKIFMLCICSMFLAGVFTSCTRVTVDADEEAVLVMKPWFFGHGGVDKTPISTGLTWAAPTTDYVLFKVVPITYEEAFDDIFSNDNTPLDFTTHIRIKISEGKTPILLQNYGVDWYKNNIQEYYCNKTREYVSMFSPFDLMSNREGNNVIDTLILNDMLSYVKELSAEREFPIEIKQVITGRARPNKDQLEEMNQTAAAIQKAKTQERLKEMEIVREAAEKQRAIADKAYMYQLGLTPQQFIQLKAWEIIEKKDGANIDVLFNGDTNSMWNIRR